MPHIEPQQFYNEIQQKKVERKTIKDSLKDHYDNDPTWQKIKEELETIRNRKKSYDLTVKEAYMSDFDKLAQLSEEIRSDEAILSDICFQTLMKNEKVEIKDERGKEYLPVIKVVFKRAK